MGFLNREMILNSKDRVIEKVDVPEWNGFIYVRSITALEKEQIEELYRREREEGKRVEHPRALFLTMTICDETGKSIFSQDDIEKLSEKNIVPLDRCFVRAQKISRLDKIDLDEMEKNSRPDQSEK